MRRAFFPLLALSCAVVISAACGDSPAPEPVTPAEGAVVRDTLRDRSFRQFEPDRDASHRKGVVVDFLGQPTLWAQYAEGERAVSEWEVVADDYLIEKHSDTSTITIRFINPMASMILPTPCTDCIDAEGVSISIRDYADQGIAEFKINDPNDVLPSPFPVFGSWTEFSEDEIMNGG